MSTRITQQIPELMVFIVQVCLSICMQAATATTHNWADQTLAQLTLDQKIGQLIMVGACSDEASQAQFMAQQPHIKTRATVQKLITNYHIGGILFFNGLIPNQIEQTREYQQLSKVPLLIAQDLEWGLTMRFANALRFPRNMTLGALADERLIFELGQEIGRQAHALGVNLVFGPVVDVNINPNNPIIHDRSFGNNPDAVARKGILMIRGLMSAGILACAKHFPGHGDTTVDSHDELPHLTHDRQRLNTIELVPFKALIAAGVPAIMVAHMHIPALDPTPGSSSLSRPIVTDLLGNELGFKGLRVTDGLVMKAVADHYKPGQEAVTALLAGNDLLVCPMDVEKAFNSIKEAVLQGNISEHELNERVLRILRAKEWLRSQPTYNPMPIYRSEEFDNQQARALKQTLYAHAITIARNQHATIPVASTQQSLAYLQIGGQHEHDFADALQKECHCTADYVSAQAQQAEADRTMRALADAKIVIVGLFDIIGFRPLNKRLEESGVIVDYGISATTRGLIKKLAEQGKEIILVLFGSPYSLQFFTDVPTVIVAYENDPDAQRAAAQVVVGKLPAQGKLPVNLG